MRKLLFMTATMFALAGCMTVRRVEPREWIAPGSRVEVDFPVPQTLYGVADSATDVIPGVRFVSGRVETASLDTLVIRVRELATEPPQPNPRVPTRVHVARDALAHVSVRRVSGEQTLILSLLLTAAAITVVFYELLGEVDELLGDAIR